MISCRMEPLQDFGGPPERFLIYVVKNPSIRTQKQKLCLGFQLASRNYESYLINTFNEYMDEDKIEEC